MEWSLDPLKAIIVSARKVSLVMAATVMRCHNAVRLFKLMVRVKNFTSTISFVLIHMTITDTKHIHARVTQLTIGFGGSMVVMEVLDFTSCHIMAIDISSDHQLLRLAKNLGRFLCA